MRTMKGVLLGLTVLLTAGMIQAQTTDEIISKHVDAMGGKDKLSKLSSIYVESATEVMGSESATKTTIINGKGYRNETDFNGQKIVQVITDKGGWMINPFAGSPDATPLPEDQYKLGQDQVYITGPLYDYAAHGGKVELVGQEKIGEVNAHKIKYTNKDNAESYYYLDPSTYYIIQVENKGNMMGQDVTITTKCSNYQKTDLGVPVPYNIDIDMGQFALKNTVKKVEVNKAVDTAIFEMGK